MCRYTTRDVYCYLSLQEKMHCKMSVQQVWHFMRRILQVHWRRMLYLSLPIDSVGHSIRYTNIRFSLSHIFQYMGRIQGHSCENMYQKKLPYFTQSDVFHWLAQKITHHRTRTIDIILKINNCKEVFI